MVLNFVIAALRELTDHRARHSLDLTQFLTTIVEEYHHQDDSNVYYLLALRTVGRASISPSTQCNQVSQPSQIIMATE